MLPEQLTEHLNIALPPLLADKLTGTGVTDLERLSGGANNETWRLTWGDTPLILRRRPFSAGAVANLEGNILGLSLLDEAQVIQLHRNPQGLVKVRELFIREGVGFLVLQAWKPTCM